ncbi:MAG: hypothetical protein IT379_26640 [Deltaproteobacteria bacterium]|nr:hypothetical protein [Deltaproteobacteria bacterium]
MDGAIDGSSARRSADAETDGETETDAEDPSVAGDGGGRRDSGLQDGGTRDEAGPCAAWCGEPTEIARIELLSRQDGRGPQTLEHIAVAGRRVGALVSARDVPRTEVETVYTIVVTDLATGRIENHPASGSVETFVGVRGSGLRADAEGWHVLFAYQPQVGAWMGGEARLGTIDWRLDGTEGVLQGGPSIAVHVSPCSCDRPVAFAPFGDEGWLATIVEGSSVVYRWWDVPARPSEGTMLDLGSSPTGSTPISTAFLPDGSLGVAGGGSASGLERRPGFVAIGTPGASDWITRPIPGEAYDAAPYVVARPAGPTVVRFASDATDLDASGIRVVEHDGSLDVRGDTRIATPFGLAPSAYTAFASPDGTSVAWAMAGMTDTAESTMHLVAMHDEIACTTVDARPVAQLERSPSSMVATWLDADVIVAAMIGADPSQLVLLRIPGCSITRVDGE